MALDLDERERVVAYLGSKHLMTLKPPHLGSGWHLADRLDPGYRN